MEKYVEVKKTIKFNKWKLRKHFINYQLITIISRALRKPFTYTRDSL